MSLVSTVKRGADILHWPLRGLCKPAANAGTLLSG